MSLLRIRNQNGIMQEVVCLRGPKGTVDNEQILDAVAEAELIPESLPNPNKLIFTGAVSAEYDGNETVTVDIPKSNNNTDSGYEELISFTTEEDLTEFNINIDTDELANKLKNSRMIYMALDIPRDEADTATTTVGKVSVSLYASWNQSLFSGLEIIPPPSVSWAKNGRAVMKCENVNWGYVSGFNRIPIFKSSITNVENYSNLPVKRDTSYITTNPFSYVTNKNCYFTISGSQNMKAGTKFTVGVVK